MKKKWIFIGVLLVSLSVFPFFLFKIQNNHGRDADLEILKLDFSKKYKSPELIAAVTKQAVVFLRIAYGEKNYDHMLELIDKSNACIEAIAPDLPFDDAMYVEHATFNSSKKIRNYLKFNSYLSGGVYTGLRPDTKYCEFDPYE
ncbi:MAG: hypothetical protein ACXVCP_15425 [Bdellovibrio sp.]